MERGKKLCLQRTKHLLYAKHPPGCQGSLFSQFPQHIPSYRAVPSSFFFFFLNSTLSQAKDAEVNSQLPDRTFGHFRAFKYTNWRFWTAGNLSIDWFWGCVVFGRVVAKAAAAAACYVTRWFALKEKRSYTWSNIWQFQSLKRHFVPFRNVGTQILWP